MIFCNRKGMTFSDTSTDDGGGSVDDGDDNTAAAAADDDDDDNDDALWQLILYFRLTAVSCACPYVPSSLLLLHNSTSSNTEGRGRRTRLRSAYCSVFYSPTVQ